MIVSGLASDLHFASRGLPCHAALSQRSEGLAFQVGPAAQGEQQKPGPPQKNNTQKTNLNKAQQHRPLLSKFHELRLSAHTVPAYPDRKMLGFST